MFVIELLIPVGLAVTVVGEGWHSSPTWIGICLALVTAGTVALARAPTIAQLITSGQFDTPATLQDHHRWTIRSSDASAQVRDHRIARRRGSHSNTGTRLAGFPIRQSGSNESACRFGRGASAPPPRCQRLLCQGMRVEPRPCGYESALHCSRRATSGTVRTTPSFARTAGKPAPLIGRPRTLPPTRCAPGEEHVSGEGRTDTCLRGGAGIRR